MNFGPERLMFIESEHNFIESAPALGENLFDLFHLPQLPVIMAGELKGYHGKHFIRLFIRKFLTP